MGPPRFHCATPNLTFRSFEQFLITMNQYMCSFIIDALLRSVPTHRTNPLCVAALMRRAEQGPGALKVA